MTFYMKKVTHRVKTTMKMILVAVMKIFWVSMVNKLYCGLLILVCNNPVFFQNITKIKIHSLLFFSKISNEKITRRLINRCVLWVGASYGPENTVNENTWTKMFKMKYVQQCLL